MRIGSVIIGELPTTPNTLYTERVGGSNPSPPTVELKLNQLLMPI